MTKLKDCPFCGGEAKIYKIEQNWDSDYFEGSHFIIGCRGKDCEVMPELKSKEAKFNQEPEEEEVIREWNSRAAEDTITEQNKELVEALDGLLDSVFPLVDLINTQPDDVDKYGEYIDKAKKLTAKHRESDK